MDDLGGLNGGVIEEPTEIGDAGKVQTLASTIIRFLTRSAEVKAAGDFYISPVDPDIKIPLDAATQKELLQDPTTAAWKEIARIAAGHIG